jgi:hypothetical protein
MANSWISFGPDLEPLASRSRQEAGIQPVRRDGLLVAGASAEVAARLAEAAQGTGWCALEVVTGGERQPVYVNARAARFVIDEVELD